MTQESHAPRGRKAVRTPWLALHAGHRGAARCEGVPDFEDVSFDLRMCPATLRRSTPRWPTRRRCLVSRRSAIATTGSILATRRPRRYAMTPPAARRQLHFSSDLAPRAKMVDGRLHPSGPRSGHQRTRAVPAPALQELREFSLNMSSSPGPVPWTQMSGFGGATFNQPRG